MAWKCGSGLKDEFPYFDHFVWLTVTLCFSFESFQILPWQEKISRIFSTNRVFLRNRVMRTAHGSISRQSSKRLLGGELILKGYDNATISDIVEVTPRTVSNWRKSLNEHDGDICVLARKQGSGQSSRLRSILRRHILIGSCLNICHHTHQSWTPSNNVGSTWRMLRW